MLIQKNNASSMRMQILIKVAQSFLGSKFEDLDRLPFDLRPKGMQASRCCIYKDRAVLKYRTMATLGIRPETETDELISLSQYGKMAIDRKEIEKPRLSVIDIACSSCVQSQYMVTNACKGCFAQPCKTNCPKDAIFFREGRAHIDNEKCINCGKCKDVCPYTAIIRIPIPCEEACPVDAIKKDENGVERIDEEKCISCGKCLASCPFGAVVEQSEIVDVLKEIESNKKVVAMVAPAIVGQFGGSINQLKSALKKAGFDEVVEVAYGADITTKKEAEEFVEKMSEGQDFMTTSCCPAYYWAVKTSIPEIAPFVSHTKSPMYYSAELEKQKDPNCISVFIGPCLAKRVEAFYIDHVDYVLTFEELGAILVANNVDVMEMSDEAFDDEASSQGRLFPLTGGVAGAVASLIPERIDYKPETIDGLTKANIKLLKRYAQKGCENNMIEVMCCEGGCVAGPGCVALSKRAARSIETYSQEGKNIKDL